MQIRVKEGAIDLFVPKVEKITSKNEVFYNPAQVINRDISVLLAACLLKKESVVLDLLSASGVRAIRFAKEVGMKTGLVWDKSEKADYSFEKIEDILSLF